MKTHRTIYLVVALLSGIALAAACGGKKSSSPTETFKAFFEAAKKGDAATIKRMLSKRMLKVLEEQARQEKKPLDELLVKVSLPPTLPEIRNEKISGDTATLEIKYQGVEEWRPLKFVKEEDEWKLDSD
ncbi:MAG TPA: hypothetical protein VF791_07870 [Pyrinomonadaceae bacterium]